MDVSWLPGGSGTTGWPFVGAEVSLAVLLARVLPAGWAFGLVVGEGLESCLAARQLGLKPVWALGSAQAISTFPVLSGVEALTILSERNEDGSRNLASQHAIAECGERWHGARREVILVDPPEGDTDANDALRRRSAT